MDAHRFLAKYALGAALSKDGSTHHDGSTFAYFKIPQTAQEELWKLTVFHFQTNRALFLSEHAPNVSRVFIDLDTRKDPQSGKKIGLIPNDLEEIMGKLQESVRKVRNKHVNRVLWDSTVPENYRSNCVILKSHLGDNRWTYHLVWPHMFMERGEQARMFSMVNDNLLFRCLGMDPDATRRGSLRAFLNDSVNDQKVPGLRPMMFHCVVGEDGDIFRGKTLDDYLGNPLGEEAFLLSLCRLSSLLTPHSDSMAPPPPSPLFFPDSDVSESPPPSPSPSLPMDVDRAPQSPRPHRMVHRNAFLIDTCSLDLSKIKAKMEEVWEKHADDDKLDLPRVKEEMGDMIVPMMNRFMCSLTHHNKPTYIFKITCADSRFPSLVHKSQNGAADLLENGAMYSVQYTSRKGKSRVLDFEAFVLWKRHPEHLNFSNIVFKPLGTERNKELNIFMGLEIDREVAAPHKDWSVMGRLTKRRFSVQTVLDHQFSFFCSKNPELFKYFIHWQAHRLQYPLSKTGIALVVLSHEGIGKDLIFSRVLGKIIGAHHFYQTANTNDVTGHFNACLEGKILVVFDEAGKIQPQQQSNLQTLITEEDMRIERKGMDSYKVKSAVNVIINSNLLDEPIMRVTAQSRRFVITKADSSINVDKDYFVDIIRDFFEFDSGEDEAVCLYRGVCAYAHYLYNLDLSGWNPRKIPVTETLILSKLSSMSMPHQYVYECLSAALLLHADPNYVSIPWSDDWTSLPRSDIWEGYLHWAKKHTGCPGTLTSFGSSLKSLIGIVLARPRAIVADPNSRVFSFNIPPLKTARLKFIQEYSHVHFDEDADPDLNQFLIVEPAWAEAPNP